MLRQAVDKQLGIEAFSQNIIENQQHARNIFYQQRIHHFEIVVVIQHVQVRDDVLIGDICTGKRDDAVENGQGIAQGTIGFLRDDVQRIFFRLDGFIFADFL